MKNIKETIINQRTYYASNTTKELNYRLKQLKILRQAIIDHEQEIMNALKEDLNKSPFEAYTTEIGIVLDEIRYMIKHLPKWIRRKRVKTPLAHFLSRSYTYAEPYGVALVISPWNYPLQLSIAPLIGSIAAGNCTIIKPSEHSPHTSEVIAKLISNNFDESYISVVKGGVEVSKALLLEKFDYIFFTGSVEVGKLVMEAAAKHLTPVTLELGGKSPCIVDQTADLDFATKRIIFGKLLNAGQTCVAPDYLLVQNKVKASLIDKLKESIIKFYGETPVSNQEYPKIINQKHFNRLLRILDQEEIIFGGDFNNETNHIAPTILDNVTWDSPVMEEEIFGPILPILDFENLDQVIDQVNQKPKPLSLYFFSNNKANQRNIIQNISFGGGCINDTIVHLATPHLPFGGVGESGMGAYHGKASFDTFSHQKSVLKKSNLIDIPLRYPPYKNNLKIIKKILK